MEDLQKLLPDAKLVKAFNSIGHAFMYKPNFPGGKPTMFICGNDDGAKKPLQVFLLFLVLKRKIWARWKLQEPLSHYAFFGVFPVLSAINGHMHLNY